MYYKTIIGNSTIYVTLATPAFEGATACKMLLYRYCHNADQYTYLNQDEIERVTDEKEISALRVLYEL